MISINKNTAVEGKSFAETSSKNSEGFNKQSFKKLYALEADNFWFKARNRLLIWAINKFFPNAVDFLEIGCGTAFVLKGIREKFPKMQITGTEFYDEGLNFARKRMSGFENVRLFQMDARQIPYLDSIDLIGAFDVLEHIPEDEFVLQQMFKAIRPGGGAVITVPQHMWLWSNTDVMAKHQRRYDRLELDTKLKDAGFHVVFFTSFVSLLLPFMFLARFTKKSGAAQEAELRLPKALNFFFEIIMKLEMAIIRAGVRFPLGGSLLAIVIKK